MKLFISHCCQQSFYLLWFFCPLSPALILTFNSSLTFYAFHSHHTCLFLREAAVEDTGWQQIPLLSLLGRDQVWFSHVCIHQKCWYTEATDPSWQGCRKMPPRCTGGTENYGHAQNFAACLINTHITQPKYESLWWQTQARDLSSLVQSCPSGHLLSVTEKGSCTKGHVKQQWCLLQATPHLCIAIGMRFSITLSCSSHLTCAPWWCQYFMVTRCHTTYLSLGTCLAARNASAHPSWAHPAMGTKGRDRCSFGPSFTMAYFNQNDWFFNYFLVIDDIPPLVCELL